MDKKIDQKRRLSRSTFFLLCGIIFIMFSFCMQNTNEFSITAPDKSLSVLFSLNSDSTACYRVTYGDSVILSESHLGLIREDGDFSRGLSLISASGPKQVRFSYDMSQGKRKHCRYQGVERIFHLQNPDGQKMDIIFRVSNDGAAFRFVFPDTSGDLKRIVREISSFGFLPGTRTFIQPMAEAKSGWNQVNPCYEEHYTQGLSVDSLVWNEPGWVFPALFQSGDFWFLISETAPDRNFCGCRLQQDTISHAFHVAFPQKQEFIFNGPLNPESGLPWETPWRIITIGKGLKAIVESTLGTDLAKPSKLDNASFVKPGRASWSWVLLKDDSTTYDVQKRFIDYAADMHWEYCLIDAFWNTQIGYEKIRELANYARGKNVGLFLWYNSAGDWNTAPLLPRDELLTHEDRIEEFGILRDMGIKGVKVDFFGGDGQSVMAYYQDILEDAARFDLMVNCHGATLPRGWHRTYPNLITMEAVRGFEYVTFEQLNADQEPVHCCMQPFTRNVFDPMDFTPVCFSEVPNIRRVTSNGFELALSVIFWSGIQHFAETPAGMSRVPDDVKTFMKEVPVTWDETRFIDGYPGKLVVLARRSGSAWTVAGINGENIDKSLSLDLNFLKTGQKGFLITDGDNNRSFKSGEIVPDHNHRVELKLKANGGFVMKF